MSRDEASLGVLMEQGPARDAASSVSATGTPIARNAPTASFEISIYKLMTLNRATLPSFHLTERREWRWIFSALMLTLVATSASGQRVTGPDTVALVGGTVIDVVSGSRMGRSTVVFAGDRIIGVGATGLTRPPQGARVVNVRGKFIIPGLWDMHVEQALPLWDRAPVDSNAGFFHPLFLAYGVTGVRDVAGPLAVLKRWSAETERGARIGPRLVYTGPKIGMGPVAPGAPFPITNEADLARSLALLKEGGASGAYILELDKALYPALMRGAKAVALRVEGNIPYTTTLWAASANGQRAVDHLDALLPSSSPDEGSIRRAQRLADEKPWWARLAWRVGAMRPPQDAPTLPLESWSAARANSLFVHLAANHTYQVPTLRLLGTVNRSADSAIRLPPPPLELRAPRHPSDGWPSAPYPSSHPMARMHDKLVWSVGAMHRAGVPILAGSDTPNLYAAPGLSLHDELALLVRAGLSPLDALRSATLRPAEFLGATDTLGTVGVGKVADMVILDADPTVNIAASRQIAYVVARGRVYNRAALDSLRARGVAMAAEIARYWVAKRGAEK